jgi:integrase
LNLRWSEIDFDNGFARLPDSKTGPKVLRLGAPALEILRALPRTFGPYVLPSGRARNRAEHELRATWDRVCAVAGIDGVRVHDLRHTVASTAVAAGVPIFTVSKMLGHADVKQRRKSTPTWGTTP